MGRVAGGPSDRGGRSPHRCLWRIADLRLRRVWFHDPYPARAPARPAWGRTFRPRSARLMSTYYASLLAESGILLLGALSVYIILATGQLSLGNGAFMGIGAYLSSYLTVALNLPLTLALVISAIAAGIIGAIVAFPALRLKGIYLAMATV